MTEGKREIKGRDSTARETKKRRCFEITKLPLHSPKRTTQCEEEAERKTEVLSVPSYGK